MNKKSLLSLLSFLIFLLPTFVLAETEGTSIEVNCDGIFTPEALDLIRTILQWFRILAPTLLVILVAVDFSLAVMSQDNNLLAKAISKVAKRSLATVGVILVPTLVLVISKLPGMNLILGSDPLCTNATGTVAKKVVRIAEPPRKATFYMADGIMHGSYGGGGAIGGGSYAFGDGNSAKRSVKTVTINGRTYDMYNQGFLSDIPYQSRNLAEFGCGPLAFASAVSGFNDSIGAYEAAKLVRTRTFGGIKKAFDEVGIHYDGPYFYNSNDRNESEVAKMASLVRSHLAKGKPVIALVTGGNNGETKYATNNHFITLLGETSDGKVIISNCGTEMGDLEEIIRYYLKGGRKGFLLVG